MPPTLLDRLQKIDWLVLDVDGVLTDGGIYYDNAGVESKRFHVRDGSGLKIWNYAGKRAAIITGRTSKVVEIRATELGIAPVIQGAAEKLPAFRRFLAETGCPPEQVCVMGDDVPDLGLLRYSGLAVKRIKLRVYALAGLSAGVAGMVTLGHFGTISSNSDTGYELTVIAAALSAPWR